MSKPDCPLPASPRHQRLLKSVLGGAVPDFVARFGVDAAVRRIKAELKKAKRARSRKLYAFWSGVLSDIEERAQDVIGLSNE